MLLKTKTKTTYEGETFLDSWFIGGIHRLIRPPERPYFYSPIRISGGENTPTTKKLLSTMQPKQLYKVSFPNTNILKRYRINAAIEANIPFDQRIAIDYGYNIESPPPKYDAFDIEMEQTRGMFPNPMQDRITALAYVGENYTECKLIDDVPEYEIISWFIETVNERNPDIIATYFGSFADWDWLITRARLLEIPLRIGRDGSEPFTIVRTFGGGKKIGEDRIIDIAGRVHFDVWKEVNADQSLLGIKDRKLKTVAKWFGIPVIEVDRTRMANLTKNELYDYCLSDARATRELATIYLRNAIMLAERLAIPFNMVVNRTPSLPANLFYMRKFRELDIVADKNNMERYPEFFGDRGKSYQGALVDLFTPGVYLSRVGYVIRHADFKSMYPTILHVHNYSPETIRNVQLLGGKLDSWVQYEGKKIMVYDGILGVISLEVDQNPSSITKTKIEELMNERDKIKEQMRVNPSPMLQSNQWGIKVEMNSIYGYHGLRYARCGCAPIGAHTTGHGRQWITIGTDIIADNGTPIERDTDGIYYTAEEDLSGAITDAIRDFIPDLYDKKFVRVSEDTYTDAIFYEEKGYVLRRRDGKLVFHGSGLKGRHLPRVCDYALTRVVEAVFDGDNIVDVLNDIGRDIRDLGQEYFVMTFQLRKNPRDYANSTQYGKLVESLSSHGIPFRWGDEIQFVKTVDGYTPLGARNMGALDYAYYRNRIANVVERILRVSHNFSASQIVEALKGARVYPRNRFIEKKLV